MKHLLPTLACPVLLCLFVSLTIAAPSREVRERPDGKLEVRTLTPGDGLVNWPVAQETTPAETRSAGTILWTDTNHLNAVPEDVAISGDGGYGIAGWWLNNKRVALYNIVHGAVPRWTHPMVAAFQIPVDADLSAQNLLATGRGDSLYVFASADANPTHSDWYTPPLVGYACSVADLGNAYAAGGGNPDGSAGELRVYDGSGALGFTRPLPAPPEGVAISADGLVVAANVRAFVKIWDAVTGVQRDSIPIPGETQTPAALSGDGAYLATGGFSRTAKLYHWNGASYSPVWSYVVPGTTWITSLAVSEDGSTLVAGTWTNPTGGKVVVFSTASSTPLWTDATYGDEVQSVAVTPDGTRLAAASWGRLGGTVGNIISVYDRGVPTPSFGVADDQIPGIASAMSIDVSRDGQTVFVGGKAVHAREMGYGGWTMAIAMPPAAAVSEAAPQTPTLVAWPNPSTGPVWIDFGAARIGSSRRILIAGADGRRILGADLPAGSGGWLWNGRDQSGRRVSSGAYFARILSGGGKTEDGNSLRLIRTE